MSRSRIALWPVQRTVMHICDPCSITTGVTNSSRVIRVAAARLHAVPRILQSAFFGAWSPHEISPARINCCSLRTDQPWFHGARRHTACSPCRRSPARARGSSAGSAWRPDAGRTFFFAARPGTLAAISVALRRCSLRFNSSNSSCFVGQFLAAGPYIWMRFSRSRSSSTGSLVLILQRRTFCSRVQTALGQFALQLFE